MTIYRILTAGRFVRATTDEGDGEILLSETVFDDPITADSAETVEVALAVEAMILECEKMAGRDLPWREVVHPSSAVLLEARDE